MAGIPNPTRKLALTEVPDDVWVVVAEFAVNEENKIKGTSYVLEDVVWFLPKSAGGYYFMIIRVIGAVPTNMFGVVVHESAATGVMTLEQFNSIFTPLNKEMA